MGWWGRWRARSRQEAPGPDGALALASETQALRLELADRDGVIARLEADVRRAKDGEAAQHAGRAQAEGERLLGAIATPLAQLATQSQLPDVDAPSMVAVGRSLLRHLEDEGLQLLGSVGDSEPYDPDRHEPLGESSPSAGQPVTVRLVGLGVAGVVLRRAGVELAEDVG